MWPFKSSRSSSPLPKLIFKSPEAFFEYQCKYGCTDIRENQGIVALVDTGAAESITEANRSKEGEKQTVSLRVAASDGGFQVLAQPFSDGPLLRTGDCVIWVPLQYVEAMSVLTGDPRSGWMGFIVAKIAPEIDPSKDSFEILHRYDQAA